MALTPDDVVKKRFRTTKYRRGYDEQEVDDFLDEVVAELRRLNEENEQLRTRGSGEQALVAAPEGETGEATGGATPVTGMLAMAQKLHDDYIRSGEEERDRLVGEAQEHAARIRGEAEEARRETLTNLERERSAAERSIDELRTHEREYRSRLRSYLEGQLRDLDSQEQAAAEGR